MRLQERKVGFTKCRVRFTGLLIAPLSALVRSLPAPVRHLPVLVGVPLMAVTPVQGQKPTPAQGDRATPAPGQEPQAPPREIHPEARDAIARIRSPFCPGQTLEICPSRDAAALRDSLDQMAARGLPADSLVELVVSAYGEEYRALPKRSGVGLLAWVMPPAALIAGLGLVVLALRRLKGPDAAGDGEELTDAQRERLDAALADFEEMEELE